MRQKSLSLNIIITIVAWACFLMLPFLFFPYKKNHSPFESSRFVNLFITSNIFLISFYYVNHRLLVPSILAKQKLFLYLLSITGCFFLYLTIMYEISVNSEETIAFLQSTYAQNSYYRGPYFFASGPITIFLIALAVSTGSKIIERWFTAEQVKEEVSKQQLQTELSLLKSQVNPHFLFNTLNSIYSLSVANSKKASDSVMKLSRIMRYTLEESLHDVVSLQQEIEFIKSYIDLQKIRLTENMRVSFTVAGNVETLMLAPLLFIPFIENAFKYGISTHNDTEIKVHIKAENQTVFFSCNNSVFANTNIQHGTGTGIVNTTRRLELLYPNKHELIIQHTECCYKVSLTINTEV